MSQVEREDQMAETMNTNQNKSSNPGAALYKISVLALLSGLLVTHAIMAAYLVRFYTLFASNDFFWNIQWSSGRTLAIATKIGESVRITD
ncbi:hypothetical protein CPB86DRAFT_319874 [Serendipita vermifera]|nr:hypothetical protein CPB86DRAFT_319874 [Serendipita vermifera]